MIWRHRFCRKLSHLEVLLSRSAEKPIWLLSALTKSKRVCAIVFFRHPCTAELDVSPKVRCGRGNVASKMGLDTVLLEADQCFTVSAPWTEWLKIA